MTVQLTLGVQLRDDATFANFYSGNNAELIHYLQTTSERVIYLWGYPGSGRSHLLQACCHQADAKGLASIYLPLALHTDLSPQILESIESLDLICIDDVDLIAEDRQWEEALFHAYNRAQQQPSRLIITGNTAPKNLTLKLPDLISRLTAAVIFQVQMLTDEQKIKALQLRAKLRGMKLSNDVAKFLLHHYQRDTTALFNALDKLDQASLQAKRKLTIPFVKKILLAKN